MSSRRVIRDSDEEDEYAGLSPQKHSTTSARLEEKAPAVNLGRFQDIDASLLSQTERDGSTGSTGT